MARTPLFPRSKDLATWAQQFAQRNERDFAFLRPKTGTFALTPSGTQHTVSAAAMTPLSVVMFCPASLNGAKIMAGGFYVDTKSDGTFVLVTSTTATISCSIDFVVLPPPES